MASIFYVDRSEVLAGKREELERALDELVGRIVESEPRLLSYQAFLGPEGASMTVIHAHPDSASLKHHMDVVGPLLPRFSGLVRLRAIDVYGSPGEEVLEQLRRKAALLGDATVTVHKRVAGVDAHPAWIS